MAKTGFTAFGMRNVFEFQRVDRTPDANGNRRECWKTYARVWCDVAVSSPRESEVGKAFTASSVVRLTTRYRNGVSVADRVKFGPRIFLINGSVDPDGKRRELVVTCTEVVKNGDGN